MAAEDLVTPEEAKWERPSPGRRCASHVSHAVAGVDGGQHHAVDERRRRGMGDDHAHDVSHADRAGADRVVAAVFLLGIPSGALADILDRRRYFIVTQFWVAATAAVLFTVSVLGGFRRTCCWRWWFANGIGLAMRWPVFAAIVPELVPRSQLPAALALNGVAMNLSRVVGPLVAGAIIAAPAANMSSR